MKVSLNWLKRYVEIKVPVEEFCTRMTMSGFEVEEVIDLSATMENVKVGRILKIEKHPDADKLQVCQIDVGGEEPVQIITGAQNIFEGALVPCALDHSKLPNGTEIKKGMLRGLPSNGMLCSGEELCLKEADYPGAEVYGILILQEEYAPGTDIREVLHLNDVIIDFSILSNRPDCNSVIGVAREVAVVLGEKINLPEPAYKTCGGDIHDHIAISVEDYDLCPRYMGRVVKNLRIKPSPDWMKDCIRAAGMRPINNIVDITNFVMLETGHPMHAFNLNDIAGHQIIVRRAKDGETMTTLDDKPHELNADMLVIADSEKPSCLAGIMGGLESEITPETTDLFLECAKFRRDNVRRTARTLGMRTESSARFEKGVDTIGVQYAMERALQLIDELDAGDIIEGVIDCNDGLPVERTLTVPAARINELLGVDVPYDKMVEILNALHIETTMKDGVLTCHIPYYRDDIESRADLAEEVMRIYGYEHIVGTPMRGDVIRGKKLPERIYGDQIKNLLIAQGMREITTYSFISGKAADQLGLSADDKRREAVVLLNPLGEEYSTMRTQLASSMLTVLSTNMNRKNPGGRFFELAKIFKPKALPVTEQPDEIPALCLGIYGEDEDFYTLKGIVDTLLARCGLEGEYLRSDEPYLHPGRQAKVMIPGCDEPVAVLGEVHPAAAERFGISGRVLLAEIKPEPLFASLAGKRTVYRPLPKFPASSRDLSVIADRELPIAEMEKAIRAAASDLVEKVELFDVYQGGQIPADKKSVAYSILLRAPDRTLTDAECDEAMKKILNALAKIHVILRQ